MFIQSISLRRIKSMQFEGKPLITLPEKTITLHTVTLTADEQKVYDALATEARQKIEGFIEEGTLVRRRCQSGLRPGTVAVTRAHTTSARAPVSLSHRPAAQVLHERAGAAVRPASGV